MDARGLYAVILTIHPMAIAQALVFGLLAGTAALTILRHLKANRPLLKAAALALGVALISHVAITAYFQLPVEVEVVRATGE